jgi:hypothetical protein
MKQILTLLALLFVSVTFAAEETAAPTIKLFEPGEALTVVENGKGIPNGSSREDDYLEWLKTSDDSDYGYTKAKPIQIGGFLEGHGNHWSSQYFRSLLGPNGEATTFERIKSCCAFELNDPKYAMEGFKVGYLDAYQVTIEGAEPVTIYVSLYAEEQIFAPKGFTTRGKKP